jgi:hypothetical protein
MNSDSVGSSFFFMSLYFHRCPQFLHNSVLFSVFMIKAFFLIGGFCVTPSSLSAKRKISFSICCNSPMWTITWVIDLSFSLRASSTAAITIDSASAHSCIQLPDTRGDGLNVTNKKHIQMNRMFKYKEVFSDSIR